MTQQHQQPTAAFTAKWNEWFEASFKAHMSRHIAAINKQFSNVEDGLECLAGGDTGKELDDLVLELRELFGQERRTMSELIEVCQLLAGGDRYVSGRLDQISRDFKAQRGIKQQKSVETTVIEEQRTSKVQQVVNVIDTILAA